MSDIEYSNFDKNDLHLERNMITTKDKETGRDVNVYQLLFNYTDSSAPVQKLPSDGKRRARFILQGPRMKTTRPLTTRDGRNGAKDYSLWQGYEMDNTENSRWVEVNRLISSKVVDELGEKDTKAWMKHDKLRSTLPSLVPCLIYQKTCENEDGQLVYEEGSKPSSFFNFFEATTKEGKTFGTRVRIHGSRTDLSKDKWVQLLSNNLVEYTPFISYQRVSYVGGNFRLITQLDTLIIHEVFPYERQTAVDRRQEQLGVSDEDIERAKRIERMLNMVSEPSETAPSSQQTETTRQPFANEAYTSDW